MEIINNIPCFPFNLERAKNGEKVVTRGGEICNYLGVSKSAYPHIFIFTDGSRKVYSDNGTFNTLRGKYDLFMLSPDPSTIPAGAKEKFESEKAFDYKDVCLNFSGAVNGFIQHEREAIYCSVTEIRDWGFQWQTETFGQKNTGWIEFKDLIFIE